MLLKLLVFKEAGLAIAVCWFLTLTLPEPITAQNNKTDSLKLSLNALPDNSAKVDALNELCLLHAEKSPESALIYCRQAEALASDLSYTAGLARNLTNAAAISYFR